MNDDSCPYVSQPNSLEIPIENYHPDNFAPDLQTQQLEQLDELPITVQPLSNHQSIELARNSDSRVPKPHKLRSFIAGKLSNLMKCIKRNLTKMIKINLMSYVSLNFFWLILLKYGIINIYLFIIMWLFLSLWFICYKASEFIRNNNPILELLGNLRNRDQNPLNGLIPNPPAPNNDNERNPGGNNFQSNEDVLRRRDDNNLVAFHPLRFHMIVGRLHNILNQLRENQMIINAAVMGGNNREGPFNFREFQDLLINGLNRNVPQNHGFTDQEIENLPQFAYEKIENLGEAKKNEDEEQCSICLMEFQNGEIIRTLPCIHNFHKDCINQWLKRQKYCPLCKGEIVFN